MIISDPSRGTCHPSEMRPFPSQLPVRLYEYSFDRLIGLRMDIMDIAIPVAEVAVERLFSSGRDMLATRRHSMKAETMRLLMILRD